MYVWRLSGTPFLLLQSSVLIAVVYTHVYSYRFVPARLAYLYRYVYRCTRTRTSAHVYLYIYKYIKHNNLVQYGVLGTCTSTRYPCTLYVNGTSTRYKARSTLYYMQVVLVLQYIPVRCPRGATLYCTLYDVHRTCTYCDVPCAACAMYYNVHRT